MSNPDATVPGVLPAPSTTATLAGRALGIGLAGIAVTALGILVSGGHIVFTAWLVGIVFWTAVAIGILMQVLIHHAFDAYWSVVLRRQWEHWLVAFKWLALLFVPLILASWLGPKDIVWPWMNPAHIIMPKGLRVGADLDLAKKHGFLNFPTFVICTAVFFGVWIWLSARLRRASFSQDLDGDPKWTTKNRFTCGMGIPLVSLALTFAAVYWIKSLEYHWFSTMFGVWYFAVSMRVAYSVGVLIMLWLWNRGDYKGILHGDHWHCIGKMMLTFTIFWGYIVFAQYFLIWNANMPEETFFYNLREYGDWWWVGMFLVFGCFFTPFCLLLSYRYKVTNNAIRRIAWWILAAEFIDICWNVLPEMKDAQGHPLPFLSLSLVWAITSTVGIGGICVWAYLRSFATTKLIPIRDPRIAECLNPN